MKTPCRSLIRQLQGFRCWRRPIHVRNLRVPSPGYREPVPRLRSEIASPFPLPRAGLGVADVCFAASTTSTQRCLPAGAIVEPAESPILRPAAQTTTPCRTDRRARSAVACRHRPVPRRWHAGTCAPMRPGLRRSAWRWRRRGRLPDLCWKSNCTVSPSSSASGARVWPARRLGALGVGLGAKRWIGVTMPGDIDIPADGAKNLVRAPARCHLRTLNSSALCAP